MCEAVLTSRQGTKSRKSRRKKGMLIMESLGNIHDIKKTKTVGCYFEISEGKTLTK